MKVPVLETERLKLRGHRLEDFAPFAAMWADPAVTRHIGGRPFSAEESWARLLRYAGHWTLLGFGFWAVEEKATGNFAGELGFADCRRDIEPSLGQMPEAGWAFARQFHGKGYASEAMGAVIAWGDERFGPSRTACIIHPQNTASIRVAEKYGYRQLQSTTYKGQPTIIFIRDPKSIPASDMIQKGRTISVTPRGISDL